MKERVGKIVSNAERLIYAIDAVNNLEENIELKYLTMDLINNHFVFGLIYREEWVRTDLLL
jgi:hypothetical protein